MHRVPLPYLIRTARLLQPCCSLAGVRIASLQRNYSSTSPLLLLHESKPWTPAFIPLRFLSRETSYAEEKDTLSVDSASSNSDQNHVLSDEYTGSLNTGMDQSLDEEKTRLQSTTTRPTKKFSCIEVLNAFSSESPSQDEIHHCIINLWTILSFKGKLKPSEKQFISEHQNFFSLCYEVMKSTPSRPNKFLVCSLYVFVSLEVNQNSRLIRTLLQVCQERLGTFNFENISILGNALKMMQSDKNVDVLKSCVGLLTEMKFKDIKNVSTLQNMMRLAPAHLTRQYEQKALLMVDHFTIDECYKMFSVLLEINLHSESLLDSCSQKIMGGLDELSCQKIISLMDCCLKLLYFNEKLLTAVGDHIMDNLYMWNIGQICKALTVMAFLHFRYVPLLDYFADKIMQEPESQRIYNVLSATRAYSILNYLPEGKGEKFLETLRTALHLHRDSVSKKLLLKPLYNLCVLGLVPAPEINELLEDKCFLSTLDNQEKLCLDYIQLFLLLELDPCPYSTQDIEQTEAQYGHSVNVCHTVLKNYFKDPTLYQENMQFSGRCFIDFVLTLDREQSKLVPTGMQNFESSQSITQIAVLCCIQNNFTLGGLHPVGKTALRMRLLKSLGFTVVLVPVHQFMLLTEEKKLEFLRENISKNISSIENSAQPHEQIAHHET